MKKNSNKKYIESKQKKLFYYTLKYNILSSFILLGSMVNKEYNKSMIITKYTTKLCFHYNIKGEKITVQRKYDSIIHCVHQNHTFVVIRYCKKKYTT